MEREDTNVRVYEIGPGLISYARQSEDGGGDSDGGVQVLLEHHSVDGCNRRAYQCRSVVVVMTGRDEIDKGVYRHIRTERMPSDQYFRSARAREAGLHAREEPVRGAFESALEAVVDFDVLCSTTHKHKLK